jgi:polyisoprenyl-phosphate glycosyltransferase
MTRMPPRLSVVVPVYNEEAGLAALQERLDGALSGVDGGYEVVYVDDGSVDGSAAWIETMAREREDVVLVQLSRNFGMEIAMSAGLDYATGECVALMHADLQDPPELIPEMLDLLASQQIDVVYARRIGRDESLLKRALATGFYALMRRLARVPYQGQAGDFRVMSRRVVDAVRTMPEQHRFLRGMVAWVGYEQAAVDYRRAGRVTGRGASYPALVRLAFEALTSFSDVPLRLASYLGMLAAVVSALSATAILAIALTGAGRPSNGISLLVAFLFLGGMQLICVGILGRYLARVHDQVLGRPLYLVSRAVRAGRPCVGVAEGGHPPAATSRPPRPVAQVGGRR